MAKSSRSGRISSILLKHELLTEDALEAAEESAKAESVRLEKFLVEKKHVTSEDMSLALSEYLRMPPITLKNFVPPPLLLEKIPMEMMAKRLIMPISLVGKNLTVALGDPFDVMAVEEITTLTSFSVTALVASEEDIKNVIDNLARESSEGLDMEELMKDDSDVVLDSSDSEEDESLDAQLESAEAAPVIRMVNMMLVEALRTEASDIHIEPMEKTLRLRYRIDGKLLEKPGPPKSLQNAVISRVKIMSDLNIAERRIPQDGRFNIKALGKSVDLRVSILPTVHGEKIVMRTLDKDSLAPSLASLGLDDNSEQAMTYAINQPHGIILVTGPTGSGKTTTLYSCLQDMNQPDVNIITCEEPVEYQLDGINQVQINADVGLSFAAALRSILRQDPDIVLVGEIRDSETAGIAVKAALTGHLVLSTLHTNDAPGAATRLIDMGIEPFMLGSCLVLAQAQRLYRKLCKSCKRPTEIDAQVLKMNHLDPAIFEGGTVFEAVGCPRCSKGFKGRGAIMEVMLVNPAIREGILKGLNTGELRELAAANGMITLKTVGLGQVVNGETSLEAALEVTGGE